jgi:glycerophosphoryl diester phosphodiesterase
VSRARDLGLLKRSDGLPIVVVHGGAEARRYRDVLEALDAALANSADCFEFDVRCTADGALVVHHDEDIDSAQLRDLRYDDARRKASERGYDLPLLENVLDRARGTLRLDVEVKEAGYEARLLGALRSAGWRGEDFVVTSFEQPALDAIHAADPAIVTGLLVYDVDGPTALRMFQGSGASFLGPDHNILDDQTLRAAMTARVPMLPWTVNDPVAMRRLMRSNAVLGVITDRPIEALGARTGS